MKHGSTLFLKTAIAVIALGVFAICIFVLGPALLKEDDEGFRWLISGILLSALPFLYALLQTFKLLTYVDNETVFSVQSVSSLRNITLSGVAIAAIYTAMTPLLYSLAQIEDAPGVLAIGLIIIGASNCIAVFAAVLKRLLASAISIKAENELTV